MRDLAIHKERMEFLDMTPRNKYQDEDPEKGDYEPSGNMLVSAINTSTDPKIAAKDIYDVVEKNNRNNKKNTIIYGYSIIQSFNEKNMDPFTAHEIGLKLIEKNFLSVSEGCVVYMATHVNTAHIHNHIFIAHDTLDGIVVSYKKFPLTINELVKATNEIIVQYGFPLRPYERQRFSVKKIFRFYDENLSNFPTMNASKLIRDINYCILFAKDMESFFHELEGLGYKIITDGLKYDDAYHVYNTIHWKTDENGNNYEYPIFIKESSEGDKHLGRGYSLDSIYANILKNKEVILYENGEIGALVEGAYVYVYDTIGDSLEVFASDRSYLERIFSGDYDDLEIKPFYRAFRLIFSLDKDNGERNQKGEPVRWIAPKVIIHLNEKKFKIFDEIIRKYKPETFGELKECKRIFVNQMEELKKEKDAIKKGNKAGEKEEGSKVEQNEALEAKTAEYRKEINSLRSQIKSIDYVLNDLRSISQDMIDSLPIYRRLEGLVKEKRELKEKEKLRNRLSPEKALMREELDAYRWRENTEDSEVSVSSDISGPGNKKNFEFILDKALNEAYERELNLEEGESPTVYIYESEETYKSLQDKDMQTDDNVNTGLKDKEETAEDNLTYEEIVLLSEDIDVHADYMDVESEGSEKTTVLSNKVFDISKPEKTNKDNDEQTNKKISEGSEVTTVPDSKSTAFFVIEDEENKSIRNENHTFRDEEGSEKTTVLSHNSPAYSAIGNEKIRNNTNEDSTFRDEEDSEKATVLSHSSPAYSVFGNEDNKSTKNDSIMSWDEDGSEKTTVLTNRIHEPDTLEDEHKNNKENKTEFSREGHIKTDEQDNEYRVYSEAEIIEIINKTNNKTQAVHIFEFTADDGLIKNSTGSITDSEEKKSRKRNFFKKVFSKSKEVFEIITEIPKKVKKKTEEMEEWGEKKVKTIITKVDEGRAKIDYIDSKIDSMINKKKGTKDKAVSNMIETDNTDKTAKSETIKRDSPAVESPSLEKRKKEKVITEKSYTPHRENNTYISIERKIKSENKPNKTRSLRFEEPVHGNSYTKPYDDQRFDNETEDRNAIYGGDMFTRLENASKRSREKQREIDYEYDYDDRDRGMER